MRPSTARKPHPEATRRVTRLANVWLVAIIAYQLVVIVVCRTTCTCTCFCECTTSSPAYLPPPTAHHRAYNNSSSPHPPSHPHPPAFTKYEQHWMLDMDHPTVVIIPLVIIIPLDMVPTVLILTHHLLDVLWGMLLLGGVGLHVRHRNSNL